MDDENEENSYYSRQSRLSLYIPTHVAIVGCGGVGSWVALFFGLIGVPRISLIDKDVVDKHNLNRTPFTDMHVGQPKVEAVMELIYERRMEDPRLVIKAYESWWEDLDESVINDLECSGTTVVDCRDSTGLLSPLICDDVVTGGYNGTSMTMQYGRSYGSQSVHGDDVVRYSITPSFVIPPVFIATMIVSRIVCGGVRERAQRNANIDVRDFYGMLTLYDDFRQHVAVNYGIDLRTTGGINLDWLLNHNYGERLEKELAAERRRIRNEVLDQVRAEVRNEIEADVREELAASRAENIVPMPVFEAEYYGEES